MAQLRKGTYLDVDGKREIECRVKKVGEKNTRILLNDGTEKLVPSSSVKIEAGVTNNDAPERLVPTIPLELFYRSLRKFNGSKEEQFQSLCQLLKDRHGPKDSVFLAELFRRSVRHAEFYSNINEPFYSHRNVREAEDYTFANSLVELLTSGTPIQAEQHAIEFVDYEIFPFRTTKSCCEDGKPATSSGSGGMDILLASTMNGVVVPAIGEIKAATETVGPTFALVQSLMYCAQLITKNQFLRLKTHYDTEFCNIDDQQPRMDLVILLEVDERLNRGDLRYAMSLSKELVSQLPAYLRQIVFLSCIITGGVITCEAIIPE